MLLYPLGRVGHGSGDDLLFMADLISRLHIHTGTKQLPEARVQHFPFQVKVRVGLPDGLGLAVPLGKHLFCPCLNLLGLPLLLGRLRLFRQALPQGLFHGPVVLALHAQGFLHILKYRLGRGEFFRRFPTVFKPLPQNALNPGIVGLFVWALDQFLEVLPALGRFFGLRLGGGLGYARLRTCRFREQLQGPVVYIIIHLPHTSMVMRLRAPG